MDVDLGHLSQPCACGEKHEVEVELVCIEAGAVERLEDILGEYQNPVFICDSNTRAAAEPYLEEEFKDYLVIELNPDGLIADDHCIKKVLGQLEVCDIGLSSVSVDILVAIGGGTIHDLTRYCADEYQIPFVSIPTAASVDAYTSAMARYRKDGMIRYVHAAAPRWVLADTNIIRNAPYKLTAAGIAEIYAKYTVLLDWKVAHLVTGEYFCDRTYNIVKGALTEVDRISDDIRDGDDEDYETLMKALLMCGLAVEMTESTRPISGAEHYISRLLGLGLITDPVTVLHGECIGVSFLLLLSYYEELQEKIEKHRVHVADDSARGLEYGLMESAFGKAELMDEIIDINTPNPLDDIDLEDLEEKLPEIAELIDDVPAVNKVRKKMVEAGCLTELSQIGIPDDKKDQILQLAPYVRNRLTLLRLSKLFE